MEFNEFPHRLVLERPSTPLPEVANDQVADAKIGPLTLPPLHSLRDVIGEERFHRLRESRPSSADMRGEAMRRLHQPKL